MSEKYATIDEITAERIEEGIVLTKQLQKHVLSKGAWTTILFQCQDINPKNEGEFKPPYARLVRYRKLRGMYSIQAKFNISSAKQAIAIAQLLQEWFQESKDGEQEETTIEEE